MALKKYVNDKGVIIFGDLPFYVNLESRDVFSDSKYFYLSKDGIPLYQSGVPPDSFQEKGQLWGTPVYNWDKLEEDGFIYWIKKIKRLSFLYDYLRIDHFRGLESYFRVDWEAKDAQDGKCPTSAQWVLCGEAERSIGQGNDSWALQSTKCRRSSRTEPAQQISGMSLVPRVPLAPTPPNKVGAPGRDRTCDPGIRNPMLYPTELQARTSN